MDSIERLHQAGLEAMEETSVRQRVALGCAQVTQEMASIKPGEAIYIEMSGRVHRCKQIMFAVHPSTHPASSAEFVYLARPDSVIDGIFRLQSAS